MRCKVTTSARRGTLSRTSVSSVRRLAIINGSVAFLAPEIGIVPVSGLPPTMRIRSICEYRPRLWTPLGIPNEFASSPYGPKNQYGNSAFMLVVANSAGIGARRRLAGRLLASVRPLPRLLLAPLEVFPQGGPQTVG